MQLQITSPHIHLRPEVAQQVQKKFEQLSKKFHRILYGELVLRREQDNHQQTFAAEAKLGVPGATLFAGEKSTSLEAAIEALLKDLEHQLQKHKDQMQEQR